MSRNILKSSLQDASFSIIFQILFRCVTFILNAFVIRHVGQNVLGIMNVRLLLLESTILFLSREPLLKACLTNTKSHNWAQVVNQIWASVPICSVLSMLLVYVWINILSPTEEQYFPQYCFGCYSIALSCVLNQMTQSFFLVAQSYCFVKLRVVIETVYVTVRTIIFVVIIVYEPQQAINAFSIAQILSQIVYCIGFVVFFWWYIKELNKLKDIKSGNTVKVPAIFKDMNDFQFQSVYDFLPGFMKNTDHLFNKNLGILTLSFIKQCIVKQLLTEGERYVMTLSPVLTFSQQSMYDIVNNLGSLAARFVFRPIEDSSYFYFTQMLKRDELLEKQDQKSVTEAVTVLSQICKVVTSIGLVVVVFGQTYSNSLLYLYGGEVLTSDSLPTTLLRCHCVAVLLLAVNGVTECYVFATMTSMQLDRYNYIMVIFSVTFLVISYLLTYILGPVGFIIANCINMTARITHSIYFIQKRYQGTHYRPLEGLKPSVKFVIILIISAVITKISEFHVYPRSLLLHIAIGALCFGITILIWLFENQELLRLGIDKYKRKTSIKVD
ncbi:uncharacterized protein CBL_09363 [Carabus blaptoides fortunei]